MVKECDGAKLKRIREYLYDQLYATPIRDHERNRAIQQAITIVTPEEVARKAAAELGAVAKTKGRGQWQPLRVRQEAQREARKQAWKEELDSLLDLGGEAYFDHADRIEELASLLGYSEEDKYWHF